MPRHTHPQPQRKHARAHARFHRDRVIRRNWGRAKARYDRSNTLHPDLARRQPDHSDAWWPFTLPANALARNPFNQCSCWMCSVRPEARRLRRRRENRWWEKDIAGELADRDPAALLAATTRWQMSALRGLEVW